MRRKHAFIGLSIYLLAVVSPIAYAWEFAGWYGGGCYPALVADTRNPNVLFLGSDVAGIWKSIDGGAHWISSSRGLGCLNIAVISVGDHLVYAGTKSGLYKSDDGGIHWSDDSRGEMLAFERPGAHRAIYIAPGDDPQIVLGTHSGNVLVGSANGKKWKMLGRKPFGNVAVDGVAFSKKYGLYYASSQKGFAVFDPTLNIWRSDFKEVVSDMFLNNDGILYLAAGNQVAYSSDGGKAWTRTEAVSKGKITRIDVRKTHETVEILAGVSEGWNGSVYISENSAAWKKISGNNTYNELDNPTRKWMKGFQKPTTVSFDPHRDQVLYYTDWWGVWRSDDKGKSWNEKIVGASNTVGSDIVIDGKGQIYVATMDNGFLKSEDNGKSYGALFPSKGYSPSINGHVWRVLTSSDGEKIIATSSPWNEKVNQVALSNDGGHTFSISREGLPSKRPKQNTMWGEGYPRALAQDPLNPNVVYLGIDGDDGGGLFFSENKGASWQRFENQPGSRRVYNGLAVFGKKIFWGACGKDGGLYVSEDGGASWENRLPRLSWVFDVVRSDQATVFAAGSDGKAAIYRSQDDGMTWAKVFESPAGDACEALAIHPLNPRFIAAGVVNWNGKSGGHIILSKDGGNHWLEITVDMPESSGPAALAFSPIDGYLYALLYAGSIYKMKVEVA